MAAGAIVYSPRYEFDLGGHIWPTVKYRLVSEQLIARGLITREELVEPESCTWEDLALAHTTAYLEKIRTGGLSGEEIARLELPWTPELADGFRLMVGGTCRAATLACESGAAVHVGGGLHHAFAGHGEGFCLFNDVAVAIRRLQREHLVARAAVVDCDVHHGNGTASIFARDTSVFTCSLHQEHNYPAVKPPSDIDVGLPDGTDDEEYLRRLGSALDEVRAFRPEIVLYLAGADPFYRDRLGGLSLTHGGLRSRDRAVITRARAAGAAVAVVLAGGYASDVSDTVAAHVATVEELFENRRQSEDGLAV